MTTVRAATVSLAQALDLAKNVPVAPSVDVHGAVTLTEVRNPYLTYLAGFTEASTRRKMGECLDRIVAVQAATQGVSEQDLAACGKPSGDPRTVRTSPLRLNAEARPATSS